MATLEGQSSDIAEHEVPNAEIPNEVRAYCDQHEILSSLRTAILLALEVYNPVKAIVTRIQVDPETDERRVIVDVTVKCAVDALLPRSKQFTKRWVQVVPPEIRERIRVLYHLA